MEALDKAIVTLIRDNLHLYNTAVKDIINNHKDTLTGMDVYRLEYLIGGLNLGLEYSEKILKD